MIKLLKPPPAQSLIPSEKIDSTYQMLRLQVFVGIFTGYAGYYLVRKNFALAMPELMKLGYSKADLGFALGAISIAYGISKFVMGGVSDRCNSRVFLSLGLLLSGLTMIFMGLSAWAVSSVWVMFGLLFVNGWFQGMGWPPSGRVMVHWFSKKERGTKMSIWNIAHNVGGGLVGPIADWSMRLFEVWQSILFLPGFIAIAISVLAFCLIRDTPPSQGLPPIDVYHGEVSTQPEVHELQPSLWDTIEKYVLGNKLLWYIALANVFIYLVRYGVLDWSPTYLKEVKHYNMSQSGWAYFAYEYAGIPGTLLCGWMSDKLFKGRRAPATVIYMLFVLLAVLVYWKNPAGNVWIDHVALATIGFFIYGPIMLIGVFALDLVPRGVAGTAAGFTGLFGYLGGSVFANMIMGVILEKWQWDGGFMVLILACVLAIVCMIPTWQAEKSLKAVTH